jgi:spore maturation protein CgeB
MKILVLGRSITGACDNPHAIFYRSLLRDLANRGHDIQFIEHAAGLSGAEHEVREVAGVELNCYATLRELQHYHARDLQEADAVIVDSTAPECLALGEWVVANATGVTAFYDVNTPVTLAALRRRERTCISPALITKFRLYLSSSGGVILTQLEKNWRSPAARPLYGAADPSIFFPEFYYPQWDLGYAAPFLPDRQSALEQLMFGAADRAPECNFLLSGGDFPDNFSLPANVTCCSARSPVEQRRLYQQQRFALHVTRPDMLLAGWSPHARLFEAAACGTPVISDGWSGVEEFFTPGREILLATSAANVVRLLRELTEDDRRAIGQAARRRILSSHTTEHRALELENLLYEAGASPFTRYGIPTQTGASV